MKDIELPSRVVIGDGAIEKIKDLVRELKLGKNSLILADPTTRKIAGNRIAELLEGKLFVVEDSSKDVVDILELVGKDNIDYIVGVGGGKVIDIGKISSFEGGLPFISVPTSASHDGIASPQASLKKEKSVSVRVHSPTVVVADTEIIRKAPHRLLASGCADAISNYTAVLDWELARDERGEYYGDYSASLSMMSAQIVMNEAERIMEDISILVEALISSGVAIGIAGSSRPCSGSEHQFSHALDMICPKPALHGEQCGVGCIMMAHLHGAEWEKARDSLKKVGAPINSRELGIEEEHIIEALTGAHKIRDRYTILRDGLSREKAEDLAKKTGVI